MSRNDMEYLIRSSSGEEEKFKTISDGAALSKMIDRALNSTTDWDLFYVGPASNEHLGAIRQDSEGLKIEARI